MSKNTIKITNKNNSEAVNIVLFYNNEVVNSHPIAWEVIENLEPDKTHELEYDETRMLSVEDAWGNFFKPRHARGGEQYIVFNRNGVLTFEKVEHKKIDNNIIAVLNGLERGSISPQLIINNALAIKKNNVVPKQQAIFVINNNIYLGIDKTKSIKKGEVFAKETLEGSIHKYNLQAVTEIKL